MVTQTCIHDYYLGVDIGTYSSKGVLVEARSGALAAQASVEHSVESPRPGWAEHDADAVWWGDFTKITQTLLAESGIAPKQIRCVGTSGLGACTLPLGKDGQPLRKAILYGIDTRADAEIAELEAALTPERIFAVSGMKLSAQSTGPKMLWLKKHEPQVFAETDCFLTSQAYLVFRLTGAKTLDYFTMGDYTPLVDIRANRWHPQTSAVITPLEKLPVPGWSCDLAGRVTAQAARACGLAEGTPVIVGTTDAGAETISTGANRAGDLMVMFGSSCFFVLLTEKLMPSELFWATAWLDSSAHALQAGTSTAGSLTRWFRDQFSPLEMQAQQAGGQPAYEALARLMEDSPPGAKGLVCLPYFEGERTPIYDTQAKGMLFGLTLAHTRADVYRAMLEGTAYGIRHVIDSMRAAGAAPSRIIAAGGGTLNPGWMQAVSDIAGIEMQVLNQQSSAAYGDAFMAGVGIGDYEKLSENARWVTDVTRITPNPENQRVYEEGYAAFRQLYENTKELMHALDRMRRA